jgi:hypothetical protein
MYEKQIRDVLKFVNKVIAQEAVPGSGSTGQSLAFVSEFMKIHKKTEAKLPYHINVIDELHANENAHSRIFRVPYFWEVMMSLF